MGMPEGYRICENCGVKWPHPGPEEHQDWCAVLGAEEPSGISRGMAQMSPTEAKEDLLSCFRDTGLPVPDPGIVAAALHGELRPDRSECNECGFVWASAHHERHAQGCSRWFEKELDIRFKYHRPKQGMAEDFQVLRGHARSFAVQVMIKVPECRERSLALTSLEEAVMWANAGIARRS